MFSIQNSLASPQRLVSFGAILTKLLGSSAGLRGRCELVRAGVCVCENIRVHPCALVLLPGSPGIKWLSHKYKTNLRTSKASGERENIWGEHIIGQEEEQDGERGPLWARWALPRKDAACLRQLAQGRLTSSQQPGTTRTAGSKDVGTHHSKRRVTGGRGSRSLY